MRKVTILQGISGSGKTTLAKQWEAEAEKQGQYGFYCYSADSYFVGSGGVYRFDPSKLPEAHAQCLREFTRTVILALRQSAHIVVDNTNTMVWEVAPYYELAQAHGYEVEILYLPCLVGVALIQGTHGVPEYTLERQAGNIVEFAQTMPRHWKRRVVYAWPHCRDKL